MNVDKLVLKEHNDKFNSIPKLVVGKDAKTLREKPCFSDGSISSTAKLKLFILKCLEGQK